MQQQQRKPRQDPVSCQLCRTKKLKCNREYPCSNCVARGVTCKSATAAPISIRGAKATSNDEILQRLQRLEDVVFGKSHNGSVDDHPQSLLTPATVSSEAPTTEDRDRVEDARELEDVGTSDSTLLMSLSDSIAFPVCTLPAILQQASISGPAIQVALPEYSKAVELLEHYRVNVDHTARILHLPAVRRMLDDIYASLSVQQPVPPGNVALLLAIFTMSAYFSLPINTYLFANDDQEALLLAKTWGKGALDALDHSRRTSSGSLADAQASILMSFVMYHFDGLSPRSRHLTTNAISIGRDLRLHRIDEWDRPDSDFTTEERLEREIKRRVWWHTASTDWILSSFSGPQEGAYLVHPDHMHIRLPNECSDEELVAGKTTTTTPEPAQQYFLQRIKLAQLCREIIDTLPISSRIQHADYDQVKAVDKKLLEYLDNLPPILKISDSSHYAAKLNEDEIAAIVGLRFYVNTSAHGRRCKLHQPFLIRQSLDRRYAYSRKACLESARAVFRLQQGLDRRVPFPNPTQPQRLGTKMHFMQLATVVMVMDLCFNKNEEDEQERKAEVRAALRVFEQAAQGSQLPRRVLKSLVHMLRKHKVQIPDMADAEMAATENHSMPQPPSDITRWSECMGLQNSPTLERGPISPEIRQSLSSAVVDTTPEDIMYASVTGPNRDPAFDQFWQAAMRTDLLDDPMHWDNLFADLDTRMV